MTEAQDRPNSFPWPPLIFVAGMALAIIANWVMPLPWIRGPFAEFLVGVGVLVVLVGLAIIVAAIRTLKRGRTAVSPVHGASRLVTTGPFSFSRNPIYLGAITAMSALALATGVLWFLVAAPVSGLLVQKLAIEREERHLEARFGKKWRDYSRKVRRWI